MQRDAAGRPARAPAAARARSLCSIYPSIDRGQTCLMSGSSHVADSEAHGQAGARCKMRSGAASGARDAATVRAWMRMFTAPRSGCCGRLVTASCCSASRCCRRPPWPAAPRCHRRGPRCRSEKEDAQDGRACVRNALLSRRGHAQRMCRRDMSAFTRRASQPASQPRRVSARSHLRLAACGEAAAAQREATAGRQGHASPPRREERAAGGLEGRRGPRACAAACSSAGTCRLGRGRAERLSRAAEGGSQG